MENSKSRKSPWRSWVGDLVSQSKARVAASEALLAETESLVKRAQRLEPTPPETDEP